MKSSIVVHIKRNCSREFSSDMNYFTKNRFVAVVVIVLVLVNVATLATLWFAVLPKRENSEQENFGNGGNFGPPHGFGRPHGGRRGMEVARQVFVKELGLNAEQAAQVERLQEEHSEQMRANMRQAQELRTQLFTLLAQDSVPNAELQAVQQAIATQQARFTVEVYNHFRAIRNVCTAEQRKKFANVAQDLGRFLGPPPGAGGMPPPQPFGSERPDGKPDKKPSLQPN